MTSNSRDLILKKLREARDPFDNSSPEARQRVVPLVDLSPHALQTRFIEEAETLGCYVYVCDTPGAQAQIRQLIGDDARVLSWEASFIPLDNLHAALNGSQVADHDDGSVRVGITGVDAALAATGSLVLCSGSGKYRTTSLLPDVHIAVVTTDQIVPDLETWFETQSHETFTKPSNTVIVSGPSKTADIAQELIKGAHGPREVHIILIEG